MIVLFLATICNVSQRQGTRQSRVILVHDPSSNTCTLAPWVPKPTLLFLPCTLVVDTFSALGLPAVTSSWPGSRPF